MKDKRIRIEGNDVVLKDLGIYSDDPKEDQMINDRLREYLNSIGIKLAKIRIVESKDSKENKNE